MPSQKALHALIVAPFEMVPKQHLTKGINEATPCPFDEVTVPDADPWHSRHNTDFVVRTQDGSNWNVHRAHLLKAGTKMAQRVKEATDGSIVLSDKVTVVEPFLAYLYSKT